MVRLLKEKGEERSQTSLKLKTFTKWFSVNSMEDAVKSEVLDLFFEDFTFKELTSDVRKSGLYDVDRIMGRMEEFYNERENRTRTFYITPADQRRYDNWFVQEGQEVCPFVEDEGDEHPDGVQAAEKHPGQDPGVV